MNELRFGRERLGDPEVASRLEWLVTNGIGGYASGTVGGALTRRYHGLLVAALRPPVGRTLLLAKLAEALELNGTRVDLDTNRWVSGALEPAGHLHLESFRLEDTVPTWTWALGDTRLEKRVWMEQGENTTYVQYRLSAAPSPATLTLRALVNYRDAHETLPRGAWQAKVEPAIGGLRIEAYEGATPLWLSAPGAAAQPCHDWYHGFALPAEAERGLEAVDDHLCAGQFVVRLRPGGVFTLVASTRRDAGVGGAGPLALASALARRRAHEKSVLESWRKAQSTASRNAPEWVRQLVLAADAFVVERSTPDFPNGRSVIAGYPWFSDWGRDAMVSLPGLTLVTGRPEIARAILQTFSRHVDQGQLPNYFPDQGDTPQYNSVDSALWFFQAVRAYHEATKDDDFLTSVFPALEEVLAWYERGTRFGIQVDGADGLLAAGEPGVQLTWMDAKLGDWVVTPRQGKPVEVNALWYNALTAMVGFAHRLKRPAEAYEACVQRVQQSFERFWNADANCLYDVLDGPNGNDAAVRPNQLLAISLPDSPLTPVQRRAVLETCGRMLVTSHGLRSLSPEDRGYRGVYRGDRAARDGAYHQGTAWLWLLPHFSLAHFKVHGDRELALQYLEPLGDLVTALAAGMLPEIADGDAPHAPRGCVAQAWSVAEALRAWHELATVKAHTPQRARARTAAART